MSQTLYILIGHAACGKSTYAKKLAESTGATIVSSDELRKQLTGNEEDQSQNARLFLHDIPEAIERALVRGESVIFDAMNLKPRDRRKIMELAHQASPSIRMEAHYFAANAEKAIKWQANRERKVPDEIIRSQAQRLVLPQITEHFDYFHHVIS